MEDFSIYSGLDVKLDKISHLGLQNVRQSTFNKIGNWNYLPHINEQFSICSPENLHCIHFNVVWIHFYLDSQHDRDAIVISCVFIFNWIIWKWIPKRVFIKSLRSMNKKIKHTIGASIIHMYYHCTLMSNIIGILRYNMKLNTAQHYCNFIRWTYLSCSL